MIKENNLISMTEAVKYLGKEELKGFAKKFVKLSPEKGSELRKKLEALDMLKVKGEHISEIIDILPEKPEELSKIFNDVGLDEDETKKILDIVKQYI